MWMCIHWQFTAYYLQTACLLRMTFRQTDRKKVARRKKKLERLELLIYFVMVCMLVFLIVGAFKDYSIVWNVIWATFQSVSVATMMLTTLFSVRHIHKHSKSIEFLGIRTNSTIMKAYVIFWGLLNLANFV